MIRQIINIDEDKCTGCGLCASACHEGAIAIVDGKARLIRDDYCDGLGNCLPACPTGAITFTQREAAAYDEEAVKKNMHKKADNVQPDHKDHVQGKLPCGCPGSQSKTLHRGNPIESESSCCSADDSKQNTLPAQTSELRQWPVQIKLVPINAPYFDGANLLVAADCTAYAYGNFHKDFVRGKITLIGCPKLDEGDYTEKLTEIIRQNNIKSVTVVRMEVPCCGGIQNAVVNALKASGKFIPWQVVTISTEGEILD